MNLKKIVSAKSVQALVKHGLNLGGKEYVESWMKASTNDKDLREICEALYTDNFHGVDVLETVDLEQVRKDAENFLMRWLIGSQKLQTNSESSASLEKKQLNSRQSE